VTELAAQLRVDSIRYSTSAGSGHPTPSMSAADMLAVLISRHLRYDWDNPGNDANDHLIFARLAYQRFRTVLSTGRWQRLAAAGAWPQRPL
jgi:transketolase